MKAAGDRLGAELKGRGFVYIASLSHSGSTLLDLLLGIHPNFVGLGELSKVLELTASQINENAHMACSCGKRCEDCAFWGSFLPKLKNLAGAERKEKYSLLVDHFYSLYDDHTQIVDSSKYKEGLLHLTNLPQLELRVIHLIKDVRAFTTSHRKSTKAEMEIGRLPELFSSEKLSEWIYSQSIKSPSYLFWKWYFRNRSMQSFIEATNAPAFNLSYDQLAQNSEDVMADLFSFLGAKKVNTKKMRPDQSNSHIFMGNPMIGDAEKMSAIRYDDRWRQSKDWQLAAFLFPTITAFNAKMVHGK